MYSSQLLLLFILLFAENAFFDEMKKIEAPDVERSYVYLSEDYLSCDLTENKCDVNCCSDKDCNYWERNSFNCDETEEQKVETFVDLTEKECDIGESGPILCLHHSNSPYLGRFYQEPEIGDRPVEAKQEPWCLHRYKSDTNLQLGVTPPNKLKHRIPYNIFGKSGFCLSKPIKVPMNAVSNCVYTITEESCFTNQLFNISNFISPDLQFVYDDSDNITLSSEVYCLKNGSEYVTLSRNVLRGNAINQVNGQMKCSVYDFSKFNKSSQRCENVVVGLMYNFNLNKSFISNGTLTVFLADIPVNVFSFANMKNQTYNTKDNNDNLYLYVSQTVRVLFNHTAKNPKIMMEGYKMRQHLAYI